MAYILIHMTSYPLTRNNISNSLVAGQRT